MVLRSELVWGLPSALGLALPSESQLVWLSALPWESRLGLVSALARRFERLRSPRRTRRRELRHLRSTQTCSFPVARNSPASLPHSGWRKSLTPVRNKVSKESSRCRLDRQSIR